MPSSSHSADGVVGAVFEAERLAAADAPAVTAMVDREDPEVFAERPVAGEEVEVGVGRPPVQQQHDRRAGGTADVPRERRAPTGQLHGAAVGQLGTRTAGAVGVSMAVVAVLTVRPLYDASTSTTLTRNVPLGAWYSTVSPLRDPTQCRAERRVRADDVEVAGLLLHVADEVALGQVGAVALVDDRDDRAGGDRAVVGALDDLRGLEQVLELADAAFHVALLVLGGVVVAVLAEVAEQAGRLDLLGHRRCAHGSSGPRTRPAGARTRLGRAGSSPWRSLLPEAAAPSGLAGVHTGEPASSVRAQQCQWASVGRSCSTVRPMAHRIAVIGGDGIGPEVTAEAVKVVARRRRRPRHDRLRSRRGPLPPRRRDPQ